jgi:hypothetical protein
VVISGWFKQWLRLPGALLPERLLARLIGRRWMEIH